jgi:hypothetical protein
MQDIKNTHPVSSEKGRSPYPGRVVTMVEVFEAEVAAAQKTSTRSRHKQAPQGFSKTLSCCAAAFGAIVHINAAKAKLFRPCLAETRLSDRTREVGFLIYVSYNSILVGNCKSLRFRLLYIVAKCQTPDDDRTLSLVVQELRIFGDTYALAFGSSCVFFFLIKN